jgi:hypothetical protein
MRRSLSTIERLGLVTYVVLSSVVSCFTPTRAAQTITYYVSPTGSDRNSGTDRNHPFATINHARRVVETINRKMTSNIIVYLLKGTYHESLTFGPKDSGTNGHNIIYKAYPGQSPVLSGGKKITGWKLHDSSKNIWQASIPASFNTRQLYINGVRAHRAQGSGLPGGTTETATGYVIPNTTLANLLSPKDLEFVYNQSWVQSRCDVASITQTTVTMDEPCFQMITTWVWQKMTMPSNLENAYEFLSNSGDWSIDTTHHVISYIPKNGEDLKTADVEVGNTQTLITLNGTPNAPVQHLVFQGLTFTYTGWLQPSQSKGMATCQANLMLTNLAAAQHWNNDAFVTPTSGKTWNGIPYGSYSVETPGAVEAHAARYVQFLDNIFTHLGAAGLNMDRGSQNDVITGNTFTDISGNGLQFGDVSTPNPKSPNQIDGYTKITNNYLSHAPVEYEGGVGFFLGYTKNTLVSHNEVSDLPYSGISLGWGWGSKDTLPSVDSGNTVSNNYVHDVMLARWDGGCIYSIGPQPKGSITGNFCMHSAWHGIYPDQGSTGWKTNSNVFEHVGMVWLHPNPNSFDPSDMTADGNYTDNSQGWGFHTAITNTTVFTDNNMPSAAQTIIANAGLEAAYKHIQPHNTASVQVG